jgi:membrane protein YdbS with pleckstrin-like domain
VAALSVLPIQLFLTVWGAGFCGGFGLAAVKALHLPLPPWFTFVFFGCLFFFGIPLVVYTAKKRTYAQTEYRFFGNRLEYAEGFWTAENKTIKYDKVTETAVRRGIIQRKYGLGTIFLATPATGFQQGRAMSGIRVQDVEEPEKVYEAVQKLIGQ